MTEDFSSDILNKVVAQICQNIGFETITPSPLHVLSDLLRQYILNVGRKSQLYGELCGRSTLNLDDLNLAFQDFNICPRELCEFLKYVSPLPKTYPVPQYPVTKSDKSFRLLHLFHESDISLSANIDNSVRFSENIVAKESYLSLLTDLNYMKMETDLELSTTQEHDPVTPPNISVNKPLIAEDLPQDCKTALKIKISLGKIKESYKSKKKRSHKKKKKNKLKEKN